MGEHITLKADDCFELGGYEAKPTGETKGRVVVIQEIFGVNQHIRNVCDRYTNAGYRAVAPAIYDRAQRGFESGYDEQGMDQGRAVRAELDIDKVVLDVKAAADYLGNPGEVGVIGFCFGGLVTWLAACRLDMACAASYYGGSIAAHADENPKCPTICHFGETDHAIPLTDVEIVRSKHPEVGVYVYEGAGHGFVCDERASFDAGAEAKAKERTLALFAQHLK